MLLSAGSGARLGLALVLVAAVIGFGLAVRALTRRRHARLIASVILSPAPDDRPRLIAFCEPGCSPCRVQRAIVESLHATWHGGFAFEEVDAALSPLAGRLGIVTVPTTVVTAPNGRVVAINSGLTDAGRLASQLDAAGPGRDPHHRQGAADDRDNCAARVDAA